MWFWGLYIYRWEERGWRVERWCEILFFLAFNEWKIEKFWRIFNSNFLKTFFLWKKNLISDLVNIWSHSDFFPPISIFQSFSFSWFFPSQIKNSNIFVKKIISSQKVLIQQNLTFVSEIKSSESRVTPIWKILFYKIFIFRLERKFRRESIGTQRMNFDKK